MLRRSCQILSKAVKINPHVVEAQYAVRGLIPSTADAIKKEIAAGSDKYPFKSLVYCNIGNPQSLDQKPFTFNREVMALIDAPFLLENEAVVKTLPADAVARAREFLGHIGNATGAYTDSKGYDWARRFVADYIDARDGDKVCRKADPNEICLTDGASTGVKLMLQLLIGGSEDAVMIPLPQYPLYTAQIALLGGATAPYYLREDKGWSLDVSELEEVYATCVAEKKATPRVCVMINPGNPTGSVMDRECMEGVVRFCHKHNLLLMADEVYQENIYSPDKHFHSFREIVLSMPAPYNTETMLVSLHSTSKGFIGECGRRGGYFEMVNLPEAMHTEVTKLCSINLCANVNGQIMMALMCSPPKKGDASYDSYWGEYNAIRTGLLERAKLLASELNKMPGFSCQEVEGAMYAFPRVTLPEKYAKYNDEMNAKEGRKLVLDARWSLELLQATGVVVVPGSGFGQEPGTLHFRTTILPPMEQMERMVRDIRSFQEGIFAKYSD